MSEGGVLKRKVVAGHARSSSVAPAGAVKALGLALGRAGQQVPGLGLVVGAVRQRQTSLAELLELPEELALLAVVEGAGDGLGLVALTPPVLSSFIEVLTTGRISRADTPARKPTRTDAAMAAGLIDSVLTELEVALAGGQDLSWAGGYRYASFLPDARPLGLILEDQSYRVLVADLKLGAGARQGQVLVALPARGRAGSGLEAVGGDTAGNLMKAGAGRSEAFGWDESMQRAVMGAEADLTAVLHRMTLPLSAVLAFQPDLILPLPMAALEKVAVEGPGGRRLAEGRLGQNRGHRALRLSLAEGSPSHQEALAPLQVSPEGQSATTATPPSLRLSAAVPAERKSA